MKNAPEPDLLIGNSMSCNTVAIAYVRPVSREEEAGYVVCAADGTELAIFATRDAAYFAARQHNLEPVLLH